LSVVVHAGAVIRAGYPFADVVGQAFQALGVVANIAVAGGLSGFFPALAVPGAIHSLTDIHVW
jgi:hypothetical protein